MDDFVSREVARTNRNLFLVNVLILCALIAVVAVQWKYSANFLMGTAPISHDELSAISSPDQRFRTFVQVSSTEAFSSGVQDISQQVDKYSKEVKSETVMADYVVVVVNDRLLVVKAPLVNDGHNFKGELVPLPQDVRMAILESAAKANPEAHPMLMPVMLDSVDYHKPGYVGLGFGLPTLALVFWNLKKWSMRISNPIKHPLNALIRRCGDRMAVANALNMEVQSGTTKYGNVLVTSNWLIYRAFFSTTVINFEHLVWGYRKITKHYTYFIPTGKTHAAVVNGRFGNCFEAQMKDQKCTEFMEMLQQKAPYAILGFSAELQALWQKDAKQLVAVVDERKKDSGKRTPAPAVAEEAMTAKA